MTVNIFFLKIPYFIVFLILGGFMLGFVLWRQRKSFFLRKDYVFDFVILFIIFSIIAGRVIYVIENFDQFRYISWSQYPYYYLPGAQRVWFQQMPWTLLKFWDNGVDPSGLILGGLVFSFVYLRNKFTRQTIYTLILGVMLASIIQIFGFYLDTLYYGVETAWWMGIKYQHIDDKFRLPIQFIEIIVLLIISIAIPFLRKSLKHINILGFFLFSFGTLELILEFFKGTTDASSKGIKFIQFAFLIVIFIGILLLIFSRQKVERHEEEAIQPTNIDGGRMLKRKYSYRDFHRSFSTYHRTSPRLFGRIKRLIASRRNRDNNS